jgi:hypothetical protein
MQFIQLVKFVFLIWSSSSRTGDGDWGKCKCNKPYEGFGDVDHTIKELMSF